MSNQKNNFQRISSEQIIEMEISTVVRGRVADPGGIDPDPDPKMDPA